MSTGVLKSEHHICVRESIMKLLESSTSEGESLVLKAVEKEKERKNEPPKKV